MTCKKCGSNVKSDFKYCPYCGERLVNDFHGQYEDLVPPYIIHQPEEEPDHVSEYYAAAPEEEIPVFQEREEPAFYKASEPAPNFEDDFPEPAHYADEGSDDRTFDNSDEKHEQAPYFVYDSTKLSPPETAMHYPDPDFLMETPSRPTVSKALKREKKEIGIGLKLLLIVLVMAVATAVALFGYYFLKTPEPFQNFDLSAMFAILFRP